MSASNTFSKADIITAVSVSVGAAAVGILIYKTICKEDKCVKPKVNLDVQKDNPKVVHAFDIEDLGDKAVYCRCWRSKKVALNAPEAGMPPATKYYKKKSTIETRAEAVRFHSVMVHMRNTIRKPETTLVL